MPEGNGKKDPVEKLLQGIQAMGDKLDAACKRIDAMEQARAARPLTVEKDGESDVAPPLDPDDVGGEPGDPKPTAADSRRPRDLMAELRERRAKIAAFQSRADQVAQLFGEQASPPLTSESLNAYRRRHLQRWKKYSPDWKDVDLYGLDSAMLGVASDQILAAAAVEGRHPKPARGFLMERTHRNDAGHTVREYFGSPSVWLARHSHQRRYVKRINPKPSLGYTVDS